VFLDDQKNVKLGDFGLSRTLSAGADMARTFVGVSNIALSFDVLISLMLIYSCYPIDTILYVTSK
jgi:hypothetical protein